MTTVYDVFRLGDVVLQSGAVLGNAWIAYRSYGRLNEARDNCIVFPTYYTGTHRSNERLIGPGRALDPTRYFIVVPNLFGNGLSSSPSNMPPPYGKDGFPRVTVFDNVMCQYRLVVEHLGVRRVALVTGWSLAAVQAYHWAALFPGLVERLLPFCGAARCSPHNFVFLEGVKAALCADPAYRGGAYEQKPEAGLRAFGRVYAGWAYSQSFFRAGLYQRLGYASIEEFLIGWEDEHLAWDANDLLLKLWTWQHADLSANALYHGDFERAMRSIRATAIIMPCDQDLYFTLDDNRAEAALLADAELRPFHSPFGHCAGAPGRFAGETDFLERALADLLAR